MVGNKKNLPLETLRGIAILLVVVGHVIGSTPNGGMKIDFPHPFRYLYLWIDYIQMPLFTAISGWVYAQKPFSALGNFSTFARKKALRLLVPMTIVGTLYFVTQFLIPGTNNKGEFNQMWRIYVFPYTIYWYLPSLFLIFITQWWIDYYKKMEYRNQWLVWCFIAVILSITNDRGFMHSLPNIFSFKGALGQLPYFFTGVAAYRFGSQLYRPSNIQLLWLAALSGIILIQIVWFYPGEAASISRILYGITLIPSLFLLLKLQWYSPLFVWLGNYAYSIYLFHGFGTSGGRIIMKMLGVKSIEIIFLFATMLAIILPILMDKVLRQNLVTRMLLLGKNTKK